LQTKGQKAHVLVTPISPKKEKKFLVCCCLNREKEQPEGKARGEMWGKPRKSARHTLPFQPRAKSRRRFQL